MRFSILTQEFNYLISRCFGVISQRPVVPILGNILLEVKGKFLFVTGSDMMVTIQTSSEVTIFEEGAITLPSKTLYYLVRELKTLELEISTVEAQHVAVIRTGGSTFRIHGVNSQEYPSLPPLHFSTPLSFSSLELKEALQRTVFTISKDETQPAITGLSLRMESNRAIFIATDGKRLARVFLSLKENHEEKSYIIPSKAVEEMIKILPDSQEELVFIHFLQDKIALQTYDTLLVTKLLMLEYPELERIIPTNINQFVYLHRDELFSLLRQVALFTSDKQNAVRFIFSDGHLELSAQTNDLGEGRVSMPVPYYGNEMQIAFNPNYFMDILRHGKTETVLLGISDSFTLGVITESQENIQTSILDLSPLFILMPLRIKN